MTVFEELAAIKALVTNPPAPVVDLTPVLNGQAVTNTKVDAVQVTADEINNKLGTPTP